MATPGYLTLTGEKQGNISAGAFTADSVGNVYQDGHQDEILVQAYTHHLGLPTDMQSGQPSGQRRHGKFTIVKSIDKSSPLLHNALCSGEKINSFELKEYPCADLSPVEERVLLEVSYMATKCKKVYTWQGKNLTREDILNKVYNLPVIPS